MSTDEIVKIKGAYEKMLEDGSAFKEVDMTMISEPDVGAAEGGLGDKINETKPTPSGPVKDPDSFIDDNTDFSQHDSVIEQKMTSLRNKMSGVKSKKVRDTESKRIAILERKVQELEEALMLVMETHEQLI